MSKLILMRHAESTYNAQSIFAGSADVPLSTVGCGQAEMAAERLKALRIDLAFSSELERTQRTLEIIMKGRRGTTVHALSLLNERSFGLLEGKPKGEAIQKIGKNTFKQWRLGQCEPPPQLEIEPFGHLRIRIHQFVEKWLMVALRAGKNTLVVGHSQWLLALLMELNPTGWAPPAMDQLPNATPLTLEANKGVFALVQNADAH